MLESGMWSPDSRELRDGRTAAVRIAAASDSAALRTFFGGLSRETLRDRFHSGFREVPEHLLGKLVSVTDVGTTILVAESADDASRSRIVGEARYVRMNDSPGIAEAAIVVADEWRRVGLGRSLLSRLLAHARDAGVQTIVAYVSQENEAIIQFLRAFGARYAPGTASGGTVQMVIDLVDHAADQYLMQVDSVGGQRPHSRDGRRDQGALEVGARGTLPIR